MEHLCRRIFYQEVLWNDLKSIKNPALQLKSRTASPHSMCGRWKLIIEENLQMKWEFLLKYFKGNKPSRQPHTHYANFWKVKDFQEGKLVRKMSRLKKKKITPLTSLLTRMLHIFSPYFQNLGKETKVTT